MADASNMQNKAGEKSPKYRSSCDSCNEAKVRCSQTRPSCARCLKNRNRRCVYGVSKRFGKHGGEVSMKVEGNAKSGITARYPARPTTKTGIETPSSSSSTIDPRELLRISPESDADSSDFLKVPPLPKNWPFDNDLCMPTRSTMSQCLPTNDDHYHMMFGRHDSYPSSLQHQGLGLFDGSSDVELGSCSDDGNLADQHPSYIPLNPKCASCSTWNRPKDSSSPADICRCNEVIVTQLSLLPVLLLNNSCSTFDVELVQFQKAIGLCAKAIACTCPGKDYTSILTISMLVARIISICERSGALTGREGNNTSASLNMTGAMTPAPSPKFSVGIYEIDSEDESNLKREVWWIQIRKVESLVAGFKEMVERMMQQQACQDTTEGAAWENLVVVLDHKLQAVKTDWRVYRDQA